MSGAGATLRVEDGGVLAALQHLREASGNVRPALFDIGEYLMASQADRFDAQVSPEGDPWLPISDGWRAHKAKEGRNPDKVLTYYGTLRESMHYEVKGNSLLFGTDVPYGRIHQFGGTIHHKARSQTLLRGAKSPKFISKRSASRRTSFMFESADVGEHDQKMPARPFLGLSTEDTVEVLNIIGGWLRGDAR